MSPRRRNTSTGSSLTFPDSRSIELRSYLALAVGLFALGLSAIFTRWADAPGIVSSFYRMLIATVVTAWPFFRSLRRRKEIPWRGIWIAAGGGVLFAIDNALWATGVRLGGATNPTLLANTAPLWVGLGAMFFFHERLNWKFWLGLLVAMLGAAGILGLDSLGASTLGLGSLLGLLAGFFYGGYYLVTQRGRQFLDPLSYFWPAAFSSTICLLAACLVGNLPMSGFSSVTWMSFLGLGLITQCIGQFSINYALGNIPASLVAPTMLGQPVVTALLALLLLGEWISGWQLLAGAVVLGGVYLVYSSRLKPGQAIPRSATR